MKTEKFLESKTILLQYNCKIAKNFFFQITFYVAGGAITCIK